MSKNELSCYEKWLLELKDEDIQSVNEDFKRKKFQKFVDFEYLKKESEKLIKILETLEQARKINRKMLSEVDLEIQDILHYIEFSKNLNAYKGYCIYKKIVELRRKRRNYKDNVKNLDNFLNKIIKNACIVQETQTKETLKFEYFLDNMKNEYNKIENLKKNMYFKLKTERAKEFLKNKINNWSEIS